MYCITDYNSRYIRWEENPYVEMIGIEMPAGWLVFRDQQALLIIESLYWYLSRSFVHRPFNALGVLRSHEPLLVDEYRHSSLAYDRLRDSIRYVDRG